jgi:hypothetical protein
MSNVAVFMNLTLDGVMQAPGRPDEDLRGGFQHGGWADVQVRNPNGDPVLASVAAEAMANTGALLLGRRVAAADPPAGAGVGAGCSATAAHPPRSGWSTPRRQPPACWSRATSGPNRRREGAPTRCGRGSWSWVMTTPEHNDDQASPEDRRATTADLSWMPTSSVSTSAEAVSVTA